MKLVVIGGGASGMFAAIFAARGGASVVLLEKNEKLGKKLFITGKGRCNITNDCDVTEFLSNVVHGDKFLRSAIYGFTPTDTIEFFEGLGLALVTERGNRVFPFSQKSSDVIKVLEKELTRLKVDVRLNTEVKSLRNGDDSFEIVTDKGRVAADKVIVATGGVSYPSTGSSGDGYRFAKENGHRVTQPVQALSPILVAQNVSSLQGISLKNVGLTAIDADGNVIASEFGEMLFTNRGLSGPIALTLSSYINRYKNVRLLLDLKPALDEKILDNRLLREFEERKNQDLKNVTRALLPERLNIYYLKESGIPEWKKVNAVTKEDRQRLIFALKNLRFDVTGLAPFTESIITSGGIDVKNLKPTMESRVMDGLYFVGETVDVDALTGGFNLQIAYSTAVAAARDAVKDIADKGTLV